MLMMSLIFKVLSAILSLFLIIVSYGVISWNVFGVPTFMSGGKNCMPTVYSNISSTVEKSKTASTIFRDGSMFGERCTTY